MFAGVVTYYHWEAMLVSYLSTRITVLPFTTMGEMLKESDYRIGLMPGTIQEDFFKLSPDPMLQQAFKERIEPYLEDYPSSYADLIALTLKDESLAVYGAFFEIRQVLNM